jgi:hypothetical protein
MKANKHILIGLAGLALATLTTYAADTATDSGTFRTTAYFIGLTQGTNAAGNPAYENASLAGHNLVNLAMGRSQNDANYPDQVLAMTIAQDLSSMELVVYDQSVSNVVATIAQSTSVDTVKQQDKKEPGPNRAHFVTPMLVTPGGNNDNALTGGYFSIAGRINLNPTNGAPGTVSISLDVDPLDATVGDVDVANALDPDSVRETVRTGLAHGNGVLDIINDGNIETILVPDGHLSIRRPLPLVPVLTGGT